MLKKDPGVNKLPLNNREKAVIVDALKGRYPLPLLLGKLGISKSSYYYQRHRISFSERHKEDYTMIAAEFSDSRESYVYRRIKAMLARKGRIVSEKVIRRIMRENGMVVLLRRASKYRSYQGEISPEVPNRLERKFHADEPNQK